MIAAWARRYIGIPFKPGGRTRDAWDCYGLCLVVYREVYGVDLPAYPIDWQSRADWPALTEAITAGIRDWRRVAWREAEIGDAVVLRIAGHPLHVGVIAGTDPLRMLHVEQGINTCLERLDAPMWEKRVSGIYRWQIAR